MVWTEISNGNLPDADEVMNNFRLSATALINEVADRSVSFDFSSDQASTKTNLTYDTDENYYYGSNASVVLEMPGQAGGNFDKKYNMAFLKFQYDIYTIYDECDDSSFDTTKFTGSANETETSDYCQASDNTANVNLDADNNSNGWSGDKKFMFKAYWSVSGSSGAGNYYLYLLGTTSGQVTLKSYTGVGNPSSQTHSFEVWVDDTNKLATVYIDGVFSSVVDISSLSGNYYFRLQSSWPGGGDTVTCRYYYFRIKQGDETTTVTESFSADNGNNYTIATNSIAYINTSAQQKYATRIKLTSTVASDEIIIIKNCHYIPLTAGDN